MIPNSATHHKSKLPKMIQNISKLKFSDGAISVSNSHHILSTEILSALCNLISSNLDADFPQLFAIRISS